MKNLCADQRGATAVEYGLIAAILVIGVISSISAVADANTGLWATVQQKAADAIDQD
jgi:pilus assembly protein Flp/PilA